MRVRSGVAVLGCVVALGLAACTTSASDGTAPTSPAASNVTGKGAQNFQLRTVLDVTAGGAARCPSQIVVAPAPQRPRVACSVDRQTRYVLGPAFLTGAEVTSAAPGQPADGSTWVIDVELTDAGQAALRSATGATYQLRPPRNQVAILVDGFVVSAPAASGPISGGVQIAGGFTQEQAQILATRIVPTP